MTLMGCAFGSDGDSSPLGRTVVRVRGLFEVWDAALIRGSALTAAYIQARRMRALVCPYDISPLSAYLFHSFLTVN